MLAQPQGKGVCTPLHAALIMLYGGIFRVNGIILQARVRPILPFGRLAFAFRPVDNHSGSKCSSAFQRFQLSVPRTMIALGLTAFAFYHAVANTLAITTIIRKINK